MTKHKNRTFYHIAGCLCLVVCESEHATLLWLLVTSPTLVVSPLLTLGGAAADQGTAASAGPGGTVAAAAAAAGKGAAAGPAGAAAGAGVSAGAARALVVAAWLRLEVHVGSPEQGDRNPHNGSTCCWPGDTLLHYVPSDYKQCIGRELAVEPATTVAVGDAATKSDPCSGLW